MKTYEPPYPPDQAIKEYLFNNGWTCLDKAEAAQREKYTGIPMQPNPDLFIHPIHPMLGYSLRAAYRCELNREQEFKKLLP